MAESNNQNNPRVFISYSWKSDEYKKRVLKLASRLRGDGVIVILDQWHLKYGMNRFSFMEKNIRNSDRVLILCEEKYTEKADNRDGSGVGIETSVITPEVYGKNDQQKFIPVIMEDPFSLPTYLKSCVAIDNRNDDGYDQILYAAYGIEMDEAPPVLETPVNIKKRLSGKTKTYSETDNTTTSYQSEFNITTMNKPPIESISSKVNQRDDGNNLRHRPSKETADVPQIDLYSSSILLNYLRLADSYVNTFQYSNAIEYYTKAINYLKNNTVPPDKRMMPIYNGIAYAYHMNGAYDKSLEYYNKVLMINQLDQLDMATAYNCIGDVYRDQGRYFNALEYYNKALLIREKVLGVHHSDTTKTKKNIEFVTRFQSNRRR